MPGPLSSPQGKPPHVLQTGVACLVIASLALVIALASAGGTRAGTAANHAIRQEGSKGQEEPEGRKEKKPLINATVSVNPPVNEADDKSPVALGGGVSEDSAGPKGLIRFWLTIENRSQAAIGNVTLRHPEIPGFRLKRVCWPGSADNHCEDITAEKDDGGVEPRMLLTSVHTLVSELAKGQSLSVWGYLEAEEPAAKQQAFVTVSWQDGQQASTKTIALGQVESLSKPHAFAASAIKNFTDSWEWSFPIALAIAGALRAWWVKRKEGREKKAAAERDQSRQTWNLMLPRVQKISLTYYTPLSAYAQSLRDELAEFQKQGKPDSLLQTCYYTLIFHRTLRELLDKVGAYYFKNREAESLADLIYQKHRYLLGFIDGPGRELFSNAVGCVRLQIPYGPFKAELDKPASPIHQFWEEYEKRMLAARSATASGSAAPALVTATASVPAAAATGAVNPFLQVPGPPEKGIPAAPDAAASAVKRIFQSVFATTPMTAVAPSSVGDHIAADILVMDAYGAMMDYEANRPSLYWYGNQRAIQLKYPQSRDVFLEWRSWRDPEKVNLTEKEILRCETWGQIYLKDVEQEKDIAEAKRSVVGRAGKSVIRRVTGAPN